MMRICVSTDQPTFVAPPVLVSMQYYPFHGYVMSQCKPGSGKLMWTYIYNNCSYPIHSWALVDCYTVAQ